jgi:hypothetical protein
MRENPQWSVIYFTPNQYGLTVVSCDPRDKPKLPNLLKQAANLTKAIAEHVASGAQKSSTELVEARLAVCSGCPYRNDAQCSICGCYLAAKAGMKSQQCPVGYWPMEVPGDGGQDNATP